MANLFRCGGGRSEASYLNLMDQLVEETATGPIASFTDGANNIPSKEIVCHINPTETGTGEKSPQNPYVIGGHTEINVTQTGVNLWDEEWEVGYINTNGNPTSDVNSIRSKNYSPCVPNTTYYICSFSSPTLYIVFYDRNKTFIRRSQGNNTNITSPENAYFFKISCYGYGATYANNISFNYPSSDKIYHAYNGDTHTVPFDQTVYGGELILQEGQNDVIQPKWKSVTPIPTDAFIDTSAGMNGIYFYNVLDRNYNFIEGMCAVADVYTSTPVASGGMRIGAGNAHIYWYGIMDELGFTTREEFRTWLANNPITIYYKSTVAQDPIILPTKTQVNTLLGANNIYHDCNGDTDVTYRANGALYVQEHPITRGLMAARPTEQIQEQEEQQEEKEINKSEDNER